MRVTTKVEVNLFTREVAEMGEGFAKAYAGQMAELVKTFAQKNVSPGEGPGPHPHVTEHEDTGRLQASIEVQQRSQGFLETADVYTDEPYGLYLEKGWHARSGRFYRYPWLAPALEDAKKMSDQVARTTARQFFTDTGMPRKGRVNF